MDILYNVNDHVEYLVHYRGAACLTRGWICGLEETGHKTCSYRIKREHALQDNVGMVELWKQDIVSPLNIIGLVRNEQDR